VHALACRDKPTPLVVDCSLDSNAGIDLVPCLRPTCALLSNWTRSNLALSNVRLVGGSRGLRGWQCIRQIGVEVRRVRQSWRNKRGRHQRGRDGLTGQVAHLFSELRRLLSYLSLLAQSENKRHESNRRMLNANAQRSHEIPKVRSLL
jgi:hypothetical protein